MAMTRASLISSQSTRFLRDYLIFGLISPAKSYTLVWHLNADIGIQLAKYERKNLAGSADFPFFSYDYQNESYRLIGNQTYDTVLSTQRARWISKSLYGVDYLFLAQSAISSEQLLALLRGCSSVHYAFSISPEVLPEDAHAWL